MKQKSQNTVKNSITECSKPNTNCKTDIRQNGTKEQTERHFKTR